MHNETVQILLVEDEEAHAELVRYAFESQQIQGCAVDLVVVLGIQEAQTWLETARPTLVLADLNLPDGKGVDLVASAGDATPYPLIIMTSHGDEQVAVEVIKAGALDYIVKTPETLGNLPSITERALRGWNHVAQRRYAEEALRRSEIKYAAVFHSNPHSIVISSLRTGRLIEVNSHFLKVTGLQRDEVIGKTSEALALWEDREKRAEFIAMVSVQGTVQNFEMEARVRPGMVIICLISAECVDLGDEPCLVSVIRNITARKQAEEALRENEELERIVALRTARIQELERQRAEIEKLAATGRMAAGIAHEINNPLASIMSSFELVAAAIPTDHPRYDFVRRIEKDLDRVATIIRQMYNLYKPVQEVARTFSIEAMLEEVRVLLETYRLQREVALVIEVEGGNEPVYLPPTSVHQVIFNVVQNAIDASPARHTVTVHATTRAGWLRVAVTDEGQGITEAVRAHIFEPFFSTKDIKGMGLGLSIAQRLAVAMGGSIMFESIMGEGTVFHITLPLQPEPYDDSESGDESMMRKEPLASGSPPSDNRSC